MSDFEEGYRAGLEAALAEAKRGRIVKLRDGTTNVEDRGDDAIAESIRALLSPAQTDKIIETANKMAKRLGGGFVPDPAKIAAFNQISSPLPAPATTKPHIKGCTIILGPSSDISENIDVVFDTCVFPNVQLRGDADGNCKLVWNGDLNIDDMPYAELKARLHAQAPDDEMARIALSLDGECMALQARIIELEEKLRALATVDKDAKIEAAAKALAVAMSYDWDDLPSGYYRMDGLVDEMHVHHIIDASQRSFKELARAVLEAVSSTGGEGVQE